MSTPRYPAARYHGEGGEATARLRPAATPRELENMPRSGAAYLATGADTDGQFGLYRWDFGPEESGPDAHFHRGITESFYILSGEVRLYDGKAWTTGRSGDFLYVPQGGVHGFRNESGAEASMLLLFTPGAPREGYFEGLVDGRTRTDDERAAFMLEHDTFWV